MDWKKILLKDFGKFRDILVKIQPSVVDLVGSVNKMYHQHERYVVLFFKKCRSPAVDLLRLNTLGVIILLFNP